MFQRQQIHVDVWFFDEHVEGLSVRSPEVATIGRTARLAVPLPSGVDTIAKVSWIARHRALVRTYDGQEHILGPGDDFTLTYGPVRLEFAHQRAYTLRRLWPTAMIQATAGGTYLLGLVIVGLTLLLGTAPAVHTTYCNTWLYAAHPQFSHHYWRCPQDELAGSGSSPKITADYLQRILRGDFEGVHDDDAAMSLQVRKVSDRKGIYMPAGDKGPATEMGGAERADIRPQREHSSQIEAKARAQDQLLTSDVGTPIQLPELNADDTGDELDEADPTDDAIADSEPAPPVAEEKRGWGIRDWYDEEDEAYDSEVAETMKRLAKRVLAIDPNDPDALSVLSYYQYLSQDYDAAIKTYDTFIELFPEDPAGYNNKALIYKRRSEYVEEEHLYRLALSYDPDDHTALNNLAVNLSHQGRHEEAVQIMKDLNESQPEDPYADLHRAKIYAEIGDEVAALAYLEKALKGMTRLDTLHHIEFRQDIRLDPSFETLRKLPRFKQILWKYYGDDAPVPTD